MDLFSLTTVFLNMIIINILYLYCRLRRGKSHSTKADSYPATEPGKGPWSPRIEQVSLNQESDSGLPLEEGTSMEDFTDSTTGDGPNSRTQTQNVSDKNVKQAIAEDVGDSRIGRDSLGRRIELNNQRSQTDLSLIRRNSDSTKDVCVVDTLEGSSSTKHNVNVSSSGHSVTDDALGTATCSSHVEDDVLEAAVVENVQDGPGHPVPAAITEGLCDTNAQHSVPYAGAFDNDEHGAEDVFDADTNNNALSAHSEADDMNCPNATEDPAEPSPVHPALGSCTREDSGLSADHEESNSSLGGEARPNSQSDSCRCGQSDPALGLDADVSVEVTGDQCGPELAGSSSEDSASGCQTPLRTVMVRREVLVPQANGTDESEASSVEDNQSAGSSSSNDNIQEAGHFIASLNGRIHERSPIRRIWDANGLSPRGRCMSLVTRSWPRLPSLPSLSALSAQHVCQALTPWELQRIVSTLQRNTPVPSVLRRPRPGTVPQPPAYTMHPPQYTDTAEDLPPAYSLIDPQLSETEPSAAAAAPASTSDQVEIFPSPEESEAQTGSVRSLQEQSHERAATSQSPHTQNQGQSERQFSPTPRREEESQSPTNGRCMGTMRRDLSLDGAACSTQNVPSDTAEEIDCDASSESLTVPENRSAVSAAGASCNTYPNPTKRHCGPRGIRQREPTFCKSSDDGEHIVASAERATRRSSRRKLSCSFEDGGAVFQRNQINRALHSPSDPDSSRAPDSPTVHSRRPLPPSDNRAEAEAEDSGPAMPRRWNRVTPRAREERRQRVRQEPRVFPIPFLKGPVFGNTVEEHRHYVASYFGIQRPPASENNGNMPPGELESADFSSDLDLN